MNEEDEKIRAVVDVEVLINPASSESISRLETETMNYLEVNCTNYKNGPIDYSRNEYLMQNISSLVVCDLTSLTPSIPFWRAEIRLHLFTLNVEGSVAETLDGTSDVTAYHEWMLPCMEFNNLWEHLIYDEDIKSDLLNYATSAFIFSQNHVSHTIISLNRVVLLHGPPGTGKTSLCKALAQKLAVRYFSSYRHIALIEINSHSLFSKWFSESGKLVMKLFDYINDLLSNNDTLLFILIDEVESLSASRKASMSGSEPSDGMRVVNALLTQIDKLRNNPSVMILTTSNLSASIDDAFIDRADIKRFIGNPGVAARFFIFRDCLEELVRTGIIIGSSRIGDYNEVMEECCEQGEFGLLRDCVNESDGFSGRALRKLPFQAYSRWLCGRFVMMNEYLVALKKMIVSEKNDRSQIVLIVFFNKRLNID